ncbi:hypothetical protein Misp01_00430 [Microtetraspora sp. NBRC 13810]|nr:hypothetical protein Misp01_00430 [Microtetraspora sp. NBRC 13810]
MYPLEPGEIRDDEPERAGRQAERMLAGIEEVEAALDQIAGHGEAAAGQVTVEAAADGRVRHVAFGPRAVRLDSGTLAAELLTAIERAQQDAARQTEELMRETLDDFDPQEARTLIERITGTPW